MKARETALRSALLQAQLDLGKRDYPMIIVIGGLPGAGKSELVHRLNAWLDPRFIDTSAPWRHSDEEEDRPFFWRFWRHMPGRGRTTIFLGSWYTRLLYDSAAGNLTAPEQRERLATIQRFEHMLHNDGVLLVKLWLHVERDTQQKRLAADRIRLQHLPAAAAQWAEDPAAAQRAADQVLAGSSFAAAPWHLITAEDPRQRDLDAGATLLRRMTERAAAARSGNGATSTPYPPPAHATATPALAAVPSDLRLSKSTYRRSLAEQQERLQALAWRAHEAQRSLVAVFEGWDAAGKGSAIRRVTAAMDPRLYRVVQSSAPSDEERAQHYLWRYWRALERRGRTMLFDRSWYGRVLVERVEGFASTVEWQRAYEEINDFEAQIAGHGGVLLKFWLHISPEEQLHRFRQRETTPHKQHKITEDDWRNRERWEDYERAVLDMLALTSTPNAPWILVAANDKRYARVQILRALCDRLEQALGTQP